ncbi:MAG TPA: dTDP-4-dehydrorhamnose 3,5-epimerase [Mycobacteriales bacterium]|jgi:dTDP-4-dehydrorhamnose 3,5-epimerase|nr:dTDP-4-dehydrorhamnose 3,5-epimerase [Mycobacteriales bacterium]
MRIDPLPISGAWLCTPVVHDDSRGRFLEWLRIDLLAAATGRTFTVLQANHSLSARGVVRGIHLSDVSPGQAKLVYCSGGAVLDVVVDVRVGSPTFGVVESVMLDAAEPRAVFVAEGLGHGFCALTEEASVTYLVSSVYDPAAERIVSPFDPELAVPWPAGLDITVSPKDAEAPSLTAAAAAGLLPTYEDCVARYRDLAAG